MMVRHDFTFPPDFTSWRGKVGIADIAAKTIACLCPQKRVVVQAGGCSGLWPLALAGHFERVITFEPAPSNFEYLDRNIRKFKKISAFNLALSDSRRMVGLTRPHPKAGAWEVQHDGNDVQAVTLDEFFPDIELDALVLDVEGHELNVWRGAEKLIMRCRPLLWFEFLRNRAELEAWLSEHDYSPPQKSLSRDSFSVPNARGKGTEQ